MSDKILWLRWVCALAGIGLLPGLAAENAARPNMVVILTDDQGYSDLGCYGHPVIESPHIDQLAREGIRLTDCYAAAPNCSPSRAGLLTGRIPARTGIYDWVPDDGPMHLPASEITLATLLKKGGYATGLFGKWHLSMWKKDRIHPEMKRPFPDDHGFDYWVGVDNNALPSHHNPINYIRNGEAVGPLKGYACHLMVDEGIQWVDSIQESGKPFFLYLSFNEPHTPIGSPPELTEYYLPKTNGNEKKAEYYANITNLDRAVGTLMKALAERGLRNNTLVIFTSDNGPARGDAGVYQGVALRGRKSSLYEGGIREPGIIRWPAVIAEGQTIHTPVSFVDFLPTLCELAGVELPQDRSLDGTSLTPLFAGKEINRSKPLFWYFYKSSPCAVLRRGNWILTADPTDGDRFRSKAHPFGREDMAYIKRMNPGQFALYDIENDIAQETDVSEKYPEVFSELKKNLLSIHQSVVDEGPSWPGLMSDEELFKQRPRKRPVATPAENDQP